ncbi:protein bric-a-brac 2 isoform X2 [Drosophila subpulchrella]|uniref:protein bric-a-brac 2 isoform X2 n=1 Tax=Drosophila subpulchrella TaxID=1486046 RepID=UPI0018A188C0|nr:protein bric-a-brac 2 isoform X2 [Drosophila subpulchrella]
MDMTKQIVDFELKTEVGEVDQYEPSDYTMAPLEEPKMVVEPQLDEPEDSDRKYSPERVVETTLEDHKQDVSQGEKDTDVKSTEKDTATLVVKPKASLMNDQPMTPPPRPLTSSEVVGLRDPDDPELRLRLEAKKSRSLPVSPQPQQSLKLAGSALFEFGQRSSPVEAKIKSNPELKAPRRKMAPPSGGGDNQQFCLRWNNYQSNLTNVFDELLQSESFVDVTLSCEGHSIKAHKMVLSACSPYFQALFYDNPCQHPIIIMRDVNWSDLKALVEFMYKGEINVCQDQINPLLKVAETLKIRGLAEVSAGRGDGGASAHPMSVYDDEEEEEELASATAILRQDDDPDPEEEMKAKRPRLLAEGALDLNQRQRKRSRDGSYATPSPSLQGVESEISERCSAATPGQNQSQPLAMTTSTIVRNPFASPNPQTLEGRNSSVGGNQRNSPQPQGHSNGNGGATMHSPPGGVAAQSALPPHMAAAVAAAAHHAAVVPPPPPAAMHHHAAAAAAQQLAAQHQLAHSHAMASALAAAAAGAGGAGGAGGAVSGSGAGASAPTGGAGVAGSASASSVGSHHDDMEIKPEIAEMIREEERAKMIESGGHGGWMGAAAAATGAASVADSYQYQLQSMWQKCWNTNQQNLVQQLRFRERGPLKSWRPEAMAEAIFSVLKEGLSLSQAARKFDIPYPTFVLYANRVHNMLGPSLDGGADPRPKARGRPQRILLGMWPEELIRSVIKAVVFRDYREIKEDMGAHQYANGQAHGQTYIGGGTTTNGYHSAAAAKMAAQNASLAPPDAGSPLSSMTETLRRQILSQQQQQQHHHQQQQSHHQQQPSSHHQQQSPHAQSMNMYKSPAYLQRSEIEDQVSAAAAVAAAAAKNQQRGSENLPDLSALGLMGLPGLNVMPSRGSGGGSGGAPPNSAASYARELSRERERDRERERERELSRQYGSQSRGSSSGSGSAKSLTASQRPGAASPYSAAHYAKHQASAYNKRFLESLPAGIDFEAIANGLLQKSVNKSPRFEDFFPGPGQDMSELFTNPDAAAAAAAAAAYAPPGGAGGGGAIRESPLMKIKLEQQHATELPHED